MTQIMQNGCQICSKYREHYLKDHLNGKGMQFYELMHGDFSQHLRIPKKFTAYCKRELSDIVGLKGLSGRIWHVGLTRTDDEVILKSGWKEFAEAHNLQGGDLMVFKYDGNSCFEISIFDENHCKKEVSLLFVDSDSEKLASSKNSVEILNVECYHKVLHAQSFTTTRTCCKENEKSASNRQRTHSSCKRRVFTSTSHPKSKRCKPCLDVGAQSKRCGIKQESGGICSIEKHKHPNVYLPRRKSVTNEEEKRASQLVRSVKSDNPSFVLFLAPGNVFNQCFVCIPSGFWKAHVPSKNRTNVLQVPGLQKKWCVNLYVGDTMKRFRWTSFVIDNGLKVGDACLFELVNCLSLMTVRILRAAGQDG